MSLRARLLGVLAAVVAAASSSAQQQQPSVVIRGTVRDSASGASIAGAVVMVRTGAGNTLSRGLTSASGTYRLVAPAGAQTLQLLRIGYRPRDVRIPVRHDGVIELDVSLARLPTMLEAVRSSANGRCPSRPDATAAFALLDQARAGLLATVVGREGDPASLTVLAFDRTMDGNSDQIARQKVRLETTAQAKTSFSATRTAADFIEHGFALDSAGHMTFFGPDAEVMLDESFARGYCFRLVAAAPDDTARTHQVGLGFSALDRRRGRVDIDGSLWIDTLARTLKGIEFRYVGLDNVSAGFLPGGHVSFSELTPGVVMIDRWHLRIVGSADTTIDDAGNKSYRPGFAVHEVGGELAAARWPDGRRWTASLGTARVTATMAEGRPAPGVLIGLDSTDYQATTDSTGVLQIPYLIPGPYVVAVAEPRLTALGISLLTPTTFTAVRGSTVDVAVSVPMAEAYGNTVCRADGRLTATSWILGRATSADGQPLAGIHWKLNRLAAGAWRPIADGGVTGSSGAFHFCTSLSVGESIQLLAWREGRESSPEVVLRRVAGPLTTFPVQFRAIVASGPAASRPGAGHTLRGVVTDSVTGDVVAGAHVSLLGTSPPASGVTDSAGRFAVRDVLPGEHAVQLRTWSLDSLGIVSQSTIFFDDTLAPVRLYVPTVSQMVASLCGVGPGAGTSAAPDLSRGVVVGTVDMLGDSVPRENVTVVAAWKEAERERWLQARTDARGVFRLCGVPTNTAISLQAGADSAGVGPLDVRIPPGHPFARAELTMDRRADGHAMLGRFGLSTSVQRRELVGFVRDTSGAGVENVTIEIPSASTRTDALGAFRMWTTDVDTLPVLVRRMGYSPVTAVLTAHDRQWDTVVVQLGATPQVLGGVKVEAPRARAGGLAGLAERQKRGVGVFVTRSEIETRNTTRLSDVLRDKRGVLIVTIRGHAALRFTRYMDRAGVVAANLGGGFSAAPAPQRLPGAAASAPASAMNELIQACTPAIWLDGVNAAGMEIDDLLALDVEAVELYDSDAGLPAEFSSTGRNTPCGTVVIWTRVPPPRRRP
jgi:hypothetical protein